jgi:2-polyprenyl-3-methyl-5-hydroxy-6-metoxy-1,4-benzoquinol methylase
MTVAPPSRYTFNNAVPEAATQLGLLCQILDPHTDAVLSGLPVMPGWRCLDLGAGMGTTSRWLAERVGPRGQVVAVDRDVRHIEPVDGMTLSQGDVTELSLGDEQFDLVHARLLLMHLPQREEVLRRCVAALRPGGILVISDWDVRYLADILVWPLGRTAEAFLKVQEAMIATGVANGVSAGWAHRVSSAMAEAGLVDVRAEVYNRLWHGGEAGCLLFASNSRQLEAPLMTRGVTAEDLAIVRADMVDPATLAWSYPMVTASGRRP